MAVEPQEYVVYSSPYALYGSVRSIIDLLPESVLCQKRDSQGRLLWVGWAPAYVPYVPPTPTPDESVPLGSVPGVESVPPEGSVPGVESVPEESVPGVESAPEESAPEESVPRLGSVPVDESLGPGPEEPEISPGTTGLLTLYAYPGIGIYYTETTQRYDINGIPLKPAYELCECLEFLWLIHPRVYKESVLSEVLTGQDTDRYRDFLQAIDCPMTEFRYLIGFFLDWLDPFKCPYAILPFLSEIVGTRFNYDIPEEFARREIAAAVYLWKRKGTIENLGEMVTVLTGFRAYVREHWLDVFRTNVWGASYPDNVASTRHPYHKTNTWSGTSYQIDRHWPDAFGTHGGTCLERKKITVYLHVTDDIEYTYWFSASFKDVLLEKLYWALSKFLLFGIEYAIVWILYYDEEYAAQLQISSTLHSGTLTTKGDDDKVLDIVFYTNDNPSYTNCIENRTAFRVTWGEIADVASIDVPQEDMVKYYHPGDALPYKTEYPDVEDDGWSEYYSELLEAY